LYSIVTEVPPLVPPLVHGVAPMLVAVDELA
jgi:hypothetical protein